MFFCLLIVLLIIGYCFIKARSSENRSNPYPQSFQPNFYDEEDDLEEFDEEINDDLEEEPSSFAYPDPYEMDPRNMLYLDDDGEIVDDL